MLVSQIYQSQQSGKISSPMYPRPYRDSEDYSWTIRVDLYKKVQIVINDFISSSEIHELKVNEYLSTYNNRTTYYYLKFLLIQF